MRRNAGDSSCRAQIRLIADLIRPAGHLPVDTPSTGVDRKGPVHRIRCGSTGEHRKDPETPVVAASSGGPGKRGNSPRRWDAIPGHSISPPGSSRAPNPEFPRRASRLPVRRGRAMPGGDRVDRPVTPEQGRVCHYPRRRADSVTRVRSRGRPEAQGGSPHRPAEWSPPASAPSTRPCGSANTPKVRAP